MLGQMRTDVRKVQRIACHLHKLKDLSMEPQSDQKHTIFCKISHWLYPLWYCNSGPYNSFLGPFATSWEFGILVLQCSRIVAMIWFLYSIAVMCLCDMAKRRNWLLSWSREQQRLLVCSLDPIYFPNSASTFGQNQEH